MEVGDVIWSYFQKPTFVPAWLCINRTPGRVYVLTFIGYVIMNALVVRVEIQIPTFFISVADVKRCEFFFFYSHTDNISGNLQLSPLAAAWTCISHTECAVSGQMLHCGLAAVLFLATVERLAAKWLAASSHLLKSDGLGFQRLNVKYNLKQRTPFRVFKC